jgi:hypothetical protein
MTLSPPVVYRPDEVTALAESIRPALAKLVAVAARTQVAVLSEQRA